MRNLTEKRKLGLYVSGTIILISAIVVIASLGVVDEMGGCGEGIQTENSKKVVRDESEDNERGEMEIDDENLSSKNVSTSSERNLGIGNSLSTTVLANKYYNVKGDDMARIKEFYNGVNHDFWPNDEVAQGLLNIGIKRILVNNVDNSWIGINADGSLKIEWSFELETRLNYCEKWGFIPHIIIGHILPPALTEVFNNWPADKIGQQILSDYWEQYEQYIYAFFDHVLRERGFKVAYWEVGNEPDIGMGWLIGTDDSYPNVTRESYDAYLNLYRHISKVAKRYQMNNPKTPRIQLGGGSLTMNSFVIGDFNWFKELLRDVAKEKLKFDFFNWHFYGNSSALKGRESIEPYTNVTFRGMSEMINKWIAMYKPNTPVFMTEWGPTWLIMQEPPVFIAGNNVGAAWDAAFLNELLETGYSKAFYLGTTDPRRQLYDGSWQNIWDYVTLYTHTQVLGAIPKAPYNVFRMFSMMGKKRVSATTPSVNVGTIASRDKNRITVIVWNMGWRFINIVHETGGVEGEVVHPFTLNLIGANFLGSKLRVQRYEVSEQISNAYYLFTRGEALDFRTQLQRVDHTLLNATNGRLSYSFTLPPSSVSLIEITPQ